MYAKAEIKNETFDHSFQRKDMGWLNCEIMYVIIKLFMQYEQEAFDAEWTHCVLIFTSNIEIRYKF